MSIYSDTVQQLTDQLVADVTTLNNAVTNNSSDFAAIGPLADTVATDASNLDQAVKSTDIPPDNTMIVELTAQLLAEVSDLQAAVVAADSTAVEATNQAVLISTSNLNRCVTSMAEWVTPMPTPEQTPVPPWLTIPTTPVPD
jgi:hypothetical protein